MQLYPLGQQSNFIINPKASVRVKSQKTADFLVEQAVTICPLSIPFY